MKINMYKIIKLIAFATVISTCVLRVFSNEEIIQDWEIEENKGIDWT